MIDARNVTYAVGDRYEIGRGQAPFPDHPYERRREYINLGIDTITETHGGPISGHHARYVLRSKVSRVHPDAA